MAQRLEAWLRLRVPRQARPGERPAAFLHKLTDLSCLEEFHMRDQDKYTRGSGYNDFQSARNCRLLDLAFLPRLRKLTWPSKGGRSWSFFTQRPRAIT